MKFSLVSLFVAVSMVSSFPAFAAKDVSSTTPTANSPAFLPVSSPEEALALSMEYKTFVPHVLSIPLGMRTHAVRTSFLSTPEASVAVVGPNADGNYWVPFSAWHPVPAATTLQAGWTDDLGVEHILFQTTTTPETAGSGWQASLRGGIPGGEPLPKGAASYWVKFTGGENFTVTAKVGDLPPLLRVKPGIIFLDDRFAIQPIVSLNGLGVQIVDNVIHPPIEATGPGVVVAVCHVERTAPVLTSLCPNTRMDIPAN